MTAHFQITAIPAFQDNYFWLIHNARHAAVIDPGAAEPVLRELSARKLDLSAIVLTHHHADHIGGVPELYEQTHATVFGPAHDDIERIDYVLREGDSCVLPRLNLALQVLDVPGHTREHIAYFASNPNRLFCGDTLFAGGCGRLFDGTPAQMLASLDKLAALPDETQIFCAHEYTVANLTFAMAVDADNPQLQQRLQIERKKREQGQITLPSNIALEKATNPFLRVRTPGILCGLQFSGKMPAIPDAVHCFAALREWKNNFR